MSSCDCGTQQESRTLNTNEDIDNEVVEEKEIVISSDEDFVEAFPDFETLPNEAVFSKYQFNNSKKRQFWQFTSHLKGNIYTDASEEEWFYLPVGKYKYNSTDYILFLADETEGKTIISVLLWYQFDDSRKRFSIGMPVYSKFKDGSYTGFEFHANKVDKVKVYTDKAKKNHNIYVLDKGEYSTEYYNMSNYIRLTANDAIKEFEFAEFCNQFPKIDNNWNSQKQIDLIKDKTLHNEFSKFIYRKTKFWSGYVSEPYDFVARYSPLGYKRLNDSLHLIVMLNHAPDYNQSDINLYIIRDLNTIVDKWSLVNSTAIKTNVLYKNEVLNFKTTSDTKTSNKKFLCSEEGFLFEPESFADNYKKNLKFPYIIDSEFLNRENGFIGKLETNRFYMLLYYYGEEITSGFHAFSANAYAELYKKSNLKRVGEIELYSYFSDGGDENGVVIHKDKLYDQDISDDRPLKRNPKGEDFQKLLTNYGFMDKKILVMRKNDWNKSDFYDFIQTLQVIELPQNPKEIKVEDAAANKSEVNQTFSSFIDSIKFANEAFEPYVPLHIPIGLVRGNGQGVLIIWQTYDKNNNENIPGIYAPYWEFCLFSEETFLFSKIERFYTDTEITWELVNQLFASTKLY